MTLVVALATGAAFAGDPPPSVPRSGPTPMTGKPQPIPTVQLKPGEVPQIQFDDPIFDFGRMPSGKDVLHDYWFTNTGNGPLEILLIKPSCGCTTAGEFDRVVQPGRKGRIPIKVATAHATGTLMKTITVQTNVAPPGNNTVLSIRGDIWKAVQADPASLYFGRLTVGADDDRRISQTTVISTAGGAMMSPGNVRSSSPMFQAELTEVTPGSKYNLIITAAPPFRIGSNYATVELSTGVAEVPTLQVQCNLLVSPELEVSPDSLMVPVAGASSKRPIQIRNNGKTPMQLLSAVCNNSAVTVQLREVEAGKAWTVMVDIPAGYRRAAPEGDTIIIDTDQADKARIKVPLVENKLYRPPVAAPAAPAASSVTRAEGAPGASGATTKSTDVSRVP